VKLTWSKPSQRDLPRLERGLCRRIIDAMQSYADGERGHVKKLKGVEGEYRLRVGDWRVRFAVDASRGEAVVFRVLPRGDVYKR
jgi:mRNA interferase RelE/StbE